MNRIRHLSQTAALYLLFVGSVFYTGACRENSIAPANNSQPVAGKLVVSAAVSLRDAFGEIGTVYETQTGEKINFNFGASGALQKQIEAGAPADVFASAGVPQMDELERKELIEKETRRDFARNQLVLIVPADSKLRLAGFADLNQPEVRKIAVGNPKTVPAGQYTEQVFQKSNLKTALRPKLILAEDVRQVLDYVVRGETDAGIVYASDAWSAGKRVRLAATASEDAHAPILYPIAVVKDTERREAAQKFIDLVLSAEGQAILRKYAFDPAHADEK